MQVTLIGHPLTHSYLADPAIGHGHFSLVNHSDAPVTAHVAQARLHAGSEASPIAQPNVFDLGTEQTLPNEAITVAAGDTLDFYLGFAPVAYTGPQMSPLAVDLWLQVGTDTLKARCEVTLQQRIPRH